MGIRRLPLPQKASKIEAGAIAARWRNRRNNYRAGVQYAILSGTTVLVIASEAITYAEKNSVGGHRLDIA